MRGRMRAQRGQASIEYVGAVLLVAAVLWGAFTVLDGEAIAGAVVRQVQRALCVVSGGDCEADRQPCVTSSSSTDDEIHVNLLLVRVGRHELELIEHRSDGTVAVTWLHDTGVGFDVGIGADAWLSVAGFSLGAGESARAALLARLGGGAKTYVFANGRDADVGLAALGEGHDPPRGLLVSTQTFTGGTAAIDAQGSAGRTGVGLHLRQDDVTGTLHDIATGRTTELLERRDAALVTLGLFGVSGSGGGARDQRITLTRDASGRPLALGVVATGELGGAAKLPKVVAPVAGALTAHVAGARRWEVEEHLDLTDPANLAAARDFLAAIEGGRPLAGPIATVGAALQRRFEQAGVVDARTYAVDSSTSGGGLHVADGLKLGGGVVDREEATRLIEARQRGADGLWHRRADCLGAVA